jgi:hypothetical protein
MTERRTKLNMNKGERRVEKIGKERGQKELTGRCRKKIKKED